MEGYLQDLYGSSCCKALTADEPKLQDDIWHAYEKRQAEVFAQSCFECDPSTTPTDSLDHDDSNSQTSWMEEEYVTSDKQDISLPASISSSCTSTLSPQEESQCSATEIVESRVSNRDPFTLMNRLFVILTTQPNEYNADGELVATPLVTFSSIVRIALARPGLLDGYLDLLSNLLERQVIIMNNNIRSLIYELWTCALTSAPRVQLLWHPNAPLKEMKRQSICYFRSLRDYCVCVAVEQNAGFTAYVSPSTSGNRGAAPLDSSSAEQVLLWNKIFYSQSSLGFGTTNLLNRLLVDRKSPFSPSCLVDYILESIFKTVTTASATAARSNPKLFFTERLKDPVPGLMFAFYLYLVTGNGKRTAIADRNERQKRLVSLFQNFIKSLQQQAIFVDFSLWHYRLMTEEFNYISQLVHIILNHLHKMYNVNLSPTLQQNVALLINRHILRWSHICVLRMYLSNVPVLHKVATGLQRETPLNESESLQFRYLIVATIDRLHSVNLAKMVANAMVLELEQIVLATSCDLNVTWRNQ